MVNTEIESTLGRVYVFGPVGGVVLLSSSAAIDAHSEQYPLAVTWATWRCDDVKQDYCITGARKHDN